MKNLTGLIIVQIFLFSQFVTAQKFDKPESITFDKKTERYFVSNVGSGKILKIDKEGNTETFVSGYVSFLGIKLHKGILYSAENKKSGDDFIRAFDKETGKLMFSLSIPNSKQLNDIEFDNKGNLYVTDRVGNKIYKVSIKNKNFEIIDTTINTPNGLYFDKKNMRMLICNTIDSCSIYSFDLKTNKISTIVNTSFPHFDGITMDNKGNIYLTSWSIDWKSSVLYKYTGKNFAELLKNKNGMADIEFNKKTYCIDIANYFANSVTHFKLADE
ncbi:MAG: SMP-30/gluconolactonase/LRE family protein [Bacteroidales bacterium]|nr:SMP-30/gluconolactonase/LRE family protein [Bacteroidales bacterium]